MASAFGLLSRKLKDLWWAVFCIPDAQIGWLPFCLNRGLSLVRNGGVDLIYSTADPFTDHLIALLLSRLSGRPWVADFRDPWTQDIIYRDVGRLRRRIDEALEFLFLSRADRVIVVSSSMGDSFVRKYPTLEAGKIVTITNGYDDDDFPTDAVSIQRSGKFTIAYAGRFNSYTNRSPAFLKALRALLDEHPELDNKIEARFVGLFGEDNESLVEQLQLGNVVQPLGYLPHRECVKQLVAADTLLLTFRAQKGVEVVLSGKIFEYLAARRPILALVPEGEAARLVRETKSGIVVGPDDTPGIKEAIWHLYRHYEDGSLGLEENSSIDQFTRANLTCKLAALFSELVPEPA